jgi:hypothetical protein
MGNPKLCDFAAKVVQNNIDKIWDYIMKLGRDVIDSSKIECGTAFITYLESAIEKYS